MTSSIHEIVEIILGELKKIHQNINAISDKTYLQPGQMLKVKKIAPGILHALKFLHHNYFYRTRTHLEITLMETIEFEVKILEGHLHQLNSFVSHDDLKYFQDFKLSFNLFYHKFTEMLVNIEKLKEMVKHDVKKSALLKVYPKPEKASPLNPEEIKKEQENHEKNFKI